MSAIVIYENDGTVSYTIGATPSTGPFAIDFPWFFANEIAVTKITGYGVPNPPPVYTLLVSGADYTLTGVGADDGFHSGSVSLLAPLANCIIRIDRTMRTDKSSNFPETGAISIPAMNTLFSRLFSWIQDLLRRQGQLVADSLSGYLPLSGGTMTGHIVLPAAPPPDAAVRRDYVDAVDLSLQNQINLKAPIASPVLTGDPRSPTALVTDAPSTRIATTGYVSQVLGTRDQGNGVWAYGGTVIADPGAGNYRLLNIGGSNRTMAISTTDGDGIGRILSLLRPGDSLVFTTEVTPVTGYARYDIIGTPIHNAGWSQLPLTLTSMGSFPEAPSVGTRYRITGFLNTAAGSAPITEIIAGPGLVGGGHEGPVTISIDATKGYQLCSSAVGTGASSAMNVTFPLGAKGLKIEFYLATASPGTFGVRGSVAGVPVTSPDYYLQRIVNSGTTVFGDINFNLTSWSMAGGAIWCWGSLEFQLPTIGQGRGTWALRDPPGTGRASYAGTLETSRAMPPFDGYYFTHSVDVFQAASYIRCFAIM